MSLPENRLSAFRPFEAGDIRGNWGTVMLPIRTDESIDFGKLERSIEQLIGFGINGIYSNGTAGEFYNQTEAEYRRIHRLLARKCREGGMPFQIGVSHVSPRLSLERLKWALPLEPGAFQLILPDWFPPTDPEILAFLKKMAGLSSDVRLVLYNPPHAKVKLSPEQLGRFKNEVPQLVGVKVAGGDGDWYERMRRHGRELSVFIPGHRLATGIREGMHGAYSNVACLHPRLAQDWYELMLKDLTEALKWEKAIQAFIVQFILPYIAERQYADPACDKFMAVVGKWCDLSARMRWPYRSIPQEEAEAVRSAAVGLIPGFSRYVS